MERSAPNSAFQRRFTFALVTFFVLVLFDILLFSYLIFQSLSQREIDRALLETQREARDLAARIEEAGSGAPDLFVVMAQNEMRSLVESDLAAEFIQRVAIYDGAGNLVFHQEVRGEAGAGDLLLSDLPSGELDLVDPAAGAELPDRLPREISERIGDLGWIRIAISPDELQKRADGLRRDLLRQTLWIFAVSLVVLSLAYAIIVSLLRRARRLEEQADEADRLAYIGTLAAGLAHEIRNPLNSLNLNMQMLEEDLGQLSPAAGKGRLLAITRQEISRLERLVTDFLLYARPKPAELETVRPAALLERVRELMAGEIQSHDAVVTVEDRSKGALLEVDPGQMNQLLLNLVQNAVKATEGSGRPARIALVARSEGDRVLLTVSDNGVGISPEEQEKVFDLFYSTRKGGSGLGLAVVERIVRNHDGTVSLESRLGQGTRVTVSLPAAREERSTAEPSIAYSTTTAP